MAEGIVVDVAAMTKGLLAQVERVNNAGERIVRRGGELIAKNARAQFLGRPVKAPTGNRGTYASGQPAPSWPRPTNRSGATRDSTQVHEVRMLGPGRWQSDTYPTTKWARRLELGGSSRQQVFGQGPYITIVTRPFPSLRPGFEMSKPGLTAIYNAEWAKVLGGFKP